MATKLFLRYKRTAIGFPNAFLMETTAGAVPVVRTTDTAASGTEIQLTNNSGGAVIEFISGRVPAGGFTLSGTMTFSAWFVESNMNANVGARARVFKRTAAGSVSEIGGGPYNDGVEFSTSLAEMVWTGTPTSTAFAEDDRIIVRFYLTNIGTMASGHTCNMQWNNADASASDSFFQINENVTFKAETTPVFDQTAYRFYESGTESGSTAAEAQDTAFTAAKAGQNYQLRIRVQETAGGIAAEDDDWDLEYSYDGGGYTALVAAGDRRIAPIAAGLTNDAVTTNRLGSGSGSFYAGRCVTDAVFDGALDTTGANGGFTAQASNYTELVFGFTLRDVPPGKTITFRVRRNGTTIDTSPTVTPSLTVTGTRFYLRSGSHAASLISANGDTYKDASTTAGSSTSDYVRSITNGGTGALTWTASAGGDFVQWVSDRISNSGLTISGPIFASLWGSEASAAGDVAFQVTVHEFSSASTNGGFNTEFGTLTDTDELSSASVTEQTVAGTPTSEAIAQGNRLGFRVNAFPVDASFSAATTATLQVNGAADASGACFIQIAEVLTFYAENDYDLRAFRFYADGTESGSTALANENVDIDLAPDVIVQLRVGLQLGSNRVGYTGDDWRLQCRLNGGSWQDVTASSTVVQAAASASITDDEVTTQRLSSGTGSFNSGKADDADGELTDSGGQPGNTFTEYLYSIKVIDADTSPTDVIDFRLRAYNFGIGVNAVIPTLGQTPSITVVAAAGTTYDSSITLAGAAAMSAEGALVQNESLTLGAAAAVTEAATLTQNETFTLSGAAAVASEAIMTWASAISLAGSAAVAADTPGSTYNVPFSLAAIAAIASSGALTMSDALSLAASSALSAEAGLNYNSDISLGAGAQLAAAGTLTMSASVSLATAAGLAASGTAIFPASASFAAAGAVSATPENQISASLALAAAAALTQAGAIQISQAISLAGQAAMTVEGANAISAAITLAASSAVTIDAVAVLAGACAFGAIAALSAEGTLNINAAASLAAVATLAFVDDVPGGGPQTYNDSISLGAQAAFTAEGILVLLGTVTLPAAAAVTMAPELVISGAVTYSTAPAVTGAVTVTVPGAIALSAGAALAASGLLVIPASLSLPASAELAVAGVMVMDASFILAALAAFATDSPVGEPFAPGNDQVFTVAARPVTFTAEGRPVRWTGAARTVTFEAAERGVSFDPSDR